MRLLQFTDTHLPATPGTQVRGVATGETLARCVRHAARHHPTPQAILLTGDLAHDDAGGYAQIRSSFGGAGVPVHCLPGNHDEAEALKRGLAGAPFDHALARRHGRWLVVMLNSNVAGENHGHLDGDELERLDAALAENADAWALVCLHHHPVPHGSRWLDELMLDNPDEFFAVLARHAQVRGIAWGHTHQPLEGMRGPVRLMGTPSTCMQFAQNADEFEVDTRPPGYRWLDLEDGGGIVSGVEWVEPADD
ncbi:MAG: phosphodiesterase [Steroidobacteraceae bacterium]